MAETPNKILQRMLERLYASLASGPLLSCRPHASRQRMDLIRLGQLDGPKPTDILPMLFAPDGSAKLVGRRGEPEPSRSLSRSDDESLNDLGAASGSGADDGGVWSRLRTIIED